MNRTKNFGLLLLLLLAGTNKAGVYAQTEGNNEEMSQKTYELNPVVVTGTGTHQRLKNTAAPVSVITADEIRRAGITDFQEALTRMVPSLSFRPNAMGSYLMMNGLSNKHVLILVNGRKVTGDITGNIDLGQIDMTRIRRIEVLNGAASSLYGSDAIGGVINVITDEPKETVSVSSRSSYTRKNQFTQGLTLDMARGKVGSYTSYRYSHSDGWQNSGLTEDGDDLIETIAPLSIGYSSTNLNQKFTYDVTDRLSFYIDGGYYHRMLDRPVEREDITGGSKYNTAYEAYNWGAGAKFRFGQRHALYIDYSGTHYASRYKYLTAYDGYLPGDYALTKLQRFQDAELKGVFGFTSHSTTVFGLDCRREWLSRPDSDLDKDIRMVSAYGQHEVRLWNHLTGIVGLRYDHHEETGGQITPKVSAMYRAGGFSLRSTYAEGFRAPGIDELYYRMFKKTMGTRSSISLGNSNLDPERSRYASLCMEYGTRRFSLSVTGYVNFVRNMVTSSSTKFDDMDEAQQNRLRSEFPEIGELSSTKNLSVKEYYNFEKATVKGVEVSLNGSPFSGFTLSGNYAYAHGKGLNDGGSWQPIERSIRHTATLAGNYLHSWGDYTLNLNLSGRLQSRVFYPGDSDGDAPGYGIWSFQTRHTFDSFRDFIVEPGLGIDNLFDRKDNRPLNKNFALYSPGRSLTVSLTLKIK